MEITPSTPVLPHNWARRFFTVWTGQAFSLVGSAIVQFALVWWLTQKTGSATILATASLVAMLPQIFLAPFAGTLVDRWNRRVVMIVADSLIAVATLVLMYLFWAGRIQVWHIYLILLIRSAGGAFHYPAMQASTSLMVPREQLARIAGLNQTLSGINGIIAPPLGAFLISILPTQWVLAIDVGTAAIAVSILAAVSIPQPPRQLAQANCTARQTTFWQDLREGWEYMVGWPGLLGVSLLAMVINFLLTPAASLLPLLVTKVYKGGALQLGWMDSSFSIGIIAGGLILSAWGGFKKRIVTSMVGIAGIGLGIALLGVLPPSWFYVALVGAILAGFMQAWANGPLGAIFQATVDPDIQGRVLTLLSAGATAMSPLGLLVAGPVSDWLGVRTWYLIGGGACILMTVVGSSIPAIMNIEQNARKAGQADLPTSATK